MLDKNQAKSVILLMRSLTRPFMICLFIVKSVYETIAWFIDKAFAFKLF